MPGEVPSRILVTGGAGFIGSNLSDRLLGLGHRVTVFDALSRPGVVRNLDWLKARHGEALDVVVADVRDGAALAAAAAGADAVFHLAAQVAVTTSMVEPLADFEINVRATVTLLDALRRRDVPVPLVFASTNKVYGDLADVALQLTNDAYVPADPALRATGIGEARPLDFHTPYGCSKGAADQYALDFARSFGVPTAVLRMSCIYGPRQMGTEDQGWVAHFAISALKGERISLFGDGCQVRDVLDVDDAVDAYLGCWRNIDRVAGRAFNLGGGPRQRHQPAPAAAPYRGPHRPAGRGRDPRLAARRPALLRVGHAARRRHPGPALLAPVAGRRGATGALAGGRARHRASPRRHGAGGGLRWCR